MTFGQLEGMVVIYWSSGLSSSTVKVVFSNLVIGSVHLTKVVLQGLRMQ